MLFLSRFNSFLDVKNILNVFCCKNVSINVAQIGILMTSFIICCVALPFNHTFKTGRPMFDSEASSFKFDLVTIIVFICLLQL